MIKDASWWDAVGKNDWREKQLEKENEMNRALAMITEIDPSDAFYGCAPDWAASRVVGVGSLIAIDPDSIKKGEDSFVGVRGKHYYINALGHPTKMDYDFCFRAIKFEVVISAGE